MEERLLLEVALASPRGLLIRCADVEALRMKLYRLRKDLSGADCLRFQIWSGPEGDLALVKGPPPGALAQVLKL